MVLEERRQPALQLLHIFLEWIRKMSRRLGIFAQALMQVTRELQQSYKSLEIWPVQSSRVISLIFPGSGPTSVLRALHTERNTSLSADRYFFGLA